MSLYEKLKPEIHGILYEKTAEHLTERIKRGELATNTPVSSERQ